MNPSPIFEISERLKIIIFILVGLFAIVFLRLLYLQVFKASKYRNLANINSIRVIQKKAPRGNIFDRFGNKLVYNIPYYTVAVVPADVKNMEYIITRLSKILSVSEEEIRVKLDKVNKTQVDPVIIKENLDSKIASIIEEEKHNLSGVLVIVEPKRMYMYGGLAFHTIGYINEVTDMELLLNPSEYSMRDLIGRIGVEKECDKFLRGKNGSIRVMVDASGRKYRLAGSSEPFKGKDITLTINANIQKVAEDSLAGKTGSIIVMQPGSGDILAIVSSPSPDLKKISMGLTKEEWESIFNSPRHPLYNRAIGGTYPFGSTFKVLTALAALETGDIDENTRFFCNGRFWYSTWDYGCWKKEGHGNVDIYRAIAESCDVYFYNVGLRLGIDNIDKFASNFGLGENTGIDISGEKKGLVPTPLWKEQKEGKPWFPGNTIQLSIGQGYLLATPLQMLSLFNLVATGGVLYKPLVIKQISGADKPEFVSQPEITRSIKISKKNIEIVKKALFLVVNSDKGTGSKSKVNGVNVAGKTATVQNPHGKTHAAFIAFAPVESPSVSLIVFLEGEGEGGRDAAPIAKKILEAYFLNENNRVN